MEPPPASPADGEDPLLATVLGAYAAAPGKVRTPPLDVDVGDDAAVLQGGLTLTTDAMVDGVHFDKRLEPEDVGWKLVAASVSDLAAMGARPAWALLTLGMPTVDLAWAGGFATGLGEACAHWGVRLVGGDTVHLPGPRTASLTLGGQLVGSPLRRDGARPGDILWVTGVPGLAGMGWYADRPGPAALRALRRPDPPLAFALDIAARLPIHAAMDLSDGLARDLPRMCRASGVGAILDPERLPTHQELPADPLPVQLGGGDDYQLLMAAPASATLEIREAARRHDVGIAAIGEIVADGSARCRDGSWPPPLFAHFGRRTP